MIQALFRGYLVRKNFGNVDGLSSKKKAFEGKLPTVLEVEGEDSKDFTSNSSDDKKKENLSSGSRTDDQVSVEETSVSVDNSNHSSLQKSRTISDEEVYAILKQLDDTPVPTEEPRRKSKTYTRSLTFDDPSVQQTTVNQLTKSMTCAVGDEFQRLDIIIDNADETISNELTDGSKSVEDPTDISEITSSIKEDVQKLKETLEGGIDIHEISGDKNEESGNIADITKSIGEDVKQLEKTLSQSADIKPVESLTRPVSKDSVTSTDSVDTVIFNDIRKKELSTDNDSKEDSIVDTSTVKLPKLNEVDDDKQNLMHLNVIKEQGDILVDDILDTAKNRLEDSQNEVGRNKFAEIVFSDQKSIDPVTSEKRQSTTSDELRQLWQDEAATTIQANYRGYRVRRHLGKETSTDVKSTEEKVEEEVTKYLNQITEPIRKAFSVDKNNVDEEEKDENDKKETDSKTEKPPDVVYIPLRDYSSEERDTPLLEKPNILDNVASENKRIEGIEDTIHQPSAIQNTDSSDEKVIIENIKSAVEISKPQEHRIDLEVTSNNEDSKSADKDVEEKISACINAIVEPITKKFQPNEEEPVESETETKMVMEKSEPAYQYIPLRDYSEEEKDTDHVVIGLNDNITTSMSILKDDTEDSQNNVVETASEIKNVLESTKEIVEEENNVENVENKTDERNLNHPDAKGSEQSHAIVNPEKKEATIQSHEAYGSKEITEYINSIVEPVKQKFSPHEQTAQMLVQSTSKDKEPEYEYIPLRDYSAEGSTDDTVVLPKSNINIEDAAKEEQHIKGVEIKSSNDNKHLTTAAENFFLEAPQVVHESEVLKADSDESVKGETDIGSINQAGEETNKDKMNVENMENDITENSKLSTKNESEVTFLKRVDDKSNVSTDIDGAHIENSNVDNEKDKPKQKSENIVNMPGVDTDSKKSNELQSDSSELKENASPVTEEKPQFITNGNIDGKSEKDKPLVEQLNNNLEASVSTSFGDNHQKVSAESTEKDSANINDEKDETANGSITSSPSNIEIKSDKIEEVVDTSEQFSDLVTEAEDVGSDLKKLGGKESQFDELKNISEKKGSDMEIEQNEVLENSPKEARNQLDAESDLNLLANEKEGKNLENLSSADTKASRDTKNQLSTESDLDGENISTPITENVARLENKEEDQENISQERQSNDAVGGKQKMEKSEATEENQTSIGYKDVENIGENKNEILKESVGMPANKTDAKDIHPTLENYAGVETKIDTESEHNVRADINTEDAKEEFRDDEKHEARSDVDGSNGTAHNQINDYQSEISKRHPQTLLSEIEPKGEDVTVETDATHNTETVSNTDKDKENAGGITDSELQERIDNIESQIEKVFDKISSPSPNKSGGKDHSNVDNNGLEENMALGDNKDDVDNKSVSSKEEVQKDDLETGDDTSAEEKTQEAINAYNGEHSETITDTFEKVNKRKNKEELEELMKNGSSNLESVDEDQKDINMGNEVGFNTDTDTKLTKEHADNVNGLVETSFASNNNDDLNNGAVQVEDKAMEKEESATAPNLDKIQTIPKNSKTQQSQGEESITDEQNDEIKLDDIKAEATETYNIPESIIADQENEQSHKNGAPQDSDKIQSPHDAESALTMIAPGAKVNENGQPNFITMPSEVEPHAMKVTELNSAKSGTANAISKIEENIDRQVINENQDVNNDKLNIVEMTNNTKLEHDQIANANKDSKMSLQEKAASDANIELDNMRKADEHRILPEKQSELSVVNSKGKLSENDQTKLVEREETEAHDTKTIELTADSEISRVNTTSSELDANTPKTVILEEKKGHITEERNGDANGENNLIEVNQNKEPQHDNDISKNSEISNNEKIEPKSDIVLDNLEKIVTSGTEDKTDKDEETSAVTDKIQARTVKEAINLIDSKDKIIDNDELLSTIPIEASNNSEKPCGEVTDLEPNAILKNVTAQTANNNMITKNKSEENSEIDITQKDQNNEMHRVGGTDASLEVSGIENVEAKSHIIADNMQKVDDIQALNEKVSALNIVDSKDINGENCQINLNMVEDRNKEPDIATTDVDNTQKTAIIEHGETESRTDENGSESNKADPIKMDQNKELESDVDINNKEISGLEKIDVEACSQSDNMQKADKIQESCDKESTLNLINQNTETNLVTLEDFDKTPLNGKAKELNENSERTCVEITDAKLNTETGNTAETPIPGKENVGSNGIDDNDDTGEEEDGTSVMEVDQNKKLHHDQTTDVSHDTEISEAKKVNSGSNDDLDNQVVSSVIESSHCKEDVLDDVKSKKETEKIDECEEHIKEELVPDEVVQNEKTESTIEHSQKIIDEPETEHISITNKSVVDKVISDDKIDKNENEKTTEISGAMVASTNSNDLKNSIENDVIAQQDNQTSLTANANAYNHEYSETVTNTSEENNKRQNKEELEILTKNSSLILEPLDEGQKGVTDTKLTKEHADSINGLVETAVISNDDDDLNNETTQVQDKAMDKEKSAAASSLDKTETIPDNSKTQQSQSEESITDGQNDEIKLADVAVVASPNSNDPKNSIAQQDNQTSVTSNAIVGIDEAKEIASNINQETNEQNNEAHGPNKVQPDTTTVENHKEEIVEPLSSEEKQSGNQLFDLIGKLNI